MAHEHDLICGSCGNELRSSSQNRCHHCGAMDPLQAKANAGHQDTAGTPERPRTIGGLTPEQVLRVLEQAATANEMGVADEREGWTPRA